MASTKSERMNKFIHGLNLTITCDVMITLVPSQNYGKTLSRALKAEMFVQKMNRKPLIIASSRT